MLHLKPVQPGAEPLIVGTQPCHLSKQFAYEPDKLIA
jgi:hypothetical protein